MFVFKFEFWIKIEGGGKKKKAILGKKAFPRSFCSIFYLQILDFSNKCKIEMLIKSEWQNDNTL